MHLLYLDDSGSVGNLNQDYLVLGGVAVFEREIYWISQKLDALADKYAPGNGASVEFHANEVFKAGHPLWGQKTTDEKREVLQGVLGVLKQSQAVAFACAIHKPSFQREDSMALAFEDICSRFDMMLKRKYRLEGDAQRGMIVLDKSTYETSLQTMARDFRVNGTRWASIANLVDVPFFVDSKATRLIQLADHVAYSVFRRYQSGDSQYLDSIAMRFDSEGGRIHGLAHKTLANPECACPACLSRRLG